ncbi:MAG: hypothetical protein M1816_004164 [Peltula sp. TS41687]|nr:MAG: hypothetical protein M1816_004164 [Peltula sp. TS41687]
MYRKALLFSDSASATKILATSEPRKQQGIGRKVTGFDDKVWEENRERIVEEGNWWKFTCPVTNNNVSNNNNNANDGNNNSNSNSSNDNKGTKKDDTGLKERLLEETGNRELVEASPRDRIWGVGFGAVNAGSRRQEWGLNLLGKAIMRVRERIRKEEEEEEERGNGRAQGGGEGGGLSVE